jgi:peptide-methionine (S)-S-oxide reductase
MRHRVRPRGLERSHRLSEETAILAGGCYWGAQELIRRQPGVVSTRVGWSGGDTPNPTDDDHGDHAEAVEIVYDTEATSYRDLLEFFFQIHDPTTLNRQGNETGRYVRSAIFYTSEEQRLAALDTMADVDASGLWPGRVVTELVAAGPFWEAEEDDQDYLRKHPEGDSCHFVRPGWRLPRRPSRTA